MKGPTRAQMESIFRDAGLETEGSDFLLIGRRGSIYVQARAHARGGWIVQDAREKAHTTRSAWVRSEEYAREFITAIASPAPA